MKKSLIIILFSFSCQSALLNIKSIENTIFPLDLSSTPTLIDCNSFKSYVQNAPIADVNFIPNKCLNILLDGYAYTGMFTLSIYHQSRLIIINNLSLTGCVNSVGNPPQIGFNSIISAGNTTFGATQIKINEPNYNLEITSLDSDIICDGAQIPTVDPIFKNGFES